MFARVLKQQTPDPAVSSKALMEHVLREAGETDDEKKEKKKLRVLTAALFSPPTNRWLLFWAYRRQLSQNPATKRTAFLLGKKRGRGRMSHFRILLFFRTYFGRAGAPHGNAITLALKPQTQDLIVSLEAPAGHVWRKSKTRNSHTNGRVRR